VQGYSVVQVRPHVPVLSGAAVPLAAVIPSRVPGRGRGAWGGSASEQGGQAGSIKLAPAPPGEGGGADTKATSRLAAGQEGLFMPPALAAGPGVAARRAQTGSGSARRACRRRSG
jgi:hypothetical protein